MNRYLKFYSAIFKISFNNFLAFRLDAFLNTIFSSGIWAFFNVFSMYLVTLRVNSAFGWKTGELLLISCIYNIIIGVFSTFFARGFSQFSDLIDRGKFDLFLLRPIDSQFYVSLHTASINSMVRTLLGTVLAAWIVTIYKIPVTLTGIALFIVGALFAIFLLYSLLFMLNTLVIWAPKLDNINELFYTLRSLGRYPRETFRQLGEFGFVMISPFVLIMSTPAKLLLGKASLYDFGELILLTFAMFVLSRLFWKFALRFYTSASS